MVQPDRLTQFALRRFVRALETGRILPSLIFTILVLVFAFAAVMRVLDHDDFPTYGTAVWWAISTVTTVGYGDVVPVTPFGRLIAALLMATGFAFLSLITGTIASALVASHMSEGPTNTELAETLERIDRRLASLEERLGA